MKRIKHTLAQPVKIYYVGEQYIQHCNIGYIIILHHGNNARLSDKEPKSDSLHMQYSFTSKPSRKIS